MAYSEMWFIYSNGINKQTALMLSVEIILACRGKYVIF